MNRKKTRKIVDGAMITSIFGGLFLIDLYLGGMIGYYLYFVLPTFIVWYSYRYTLKDTAVVGVAIIATTFLISSPLNILFVITALAVGMAVGYCLKKEIKGATIFMSTVFFTLISNVLSYTVFAKLFEMDLILEITEIFNMLQATLPSGSLTVTLDIFLKFIPLILLFMSVIEGYAMLILMLLILPRLKVPFKYKFNFLFMQLPKWFGVLSVFTIGLTPLFADNLLLSYCSTIMFALLALEGLSTVGLYFSVNKKTLFYFLSILLFFIPSCMFIYLLIGLSDIFIGLKKIIMYNRFKS